MVNTSVPARLVHNWLQAPGAGLPVRTWPGTIQVSRSRVNALLLCIDLFYIHAVLQKINTSRKSTVPPHTPNILNLILRGIRFFFGISVIFE